MTWNVDLMSGERGYERTLMTREGIEADSAADAIEQASRFEIGSDWPISGNVAKEPDGIRYWMASEA